MPRCARSTGIPSQTRAAPVMSMTAPSFAGRTSKDHRTSPSGGRATATAIPPPPPGPESVEGPGRVEGGLPPVPPEERHPPASPPTARRAADRAVARQITPDLPYGFIALEYATGGPASSRKRFPPVPAAVSPGRSEDTFHVHPDQSLEECRSDLPRGS